MMNKSQIKAMSSVAKDIIMGDIKGTETNDELMTIFYDIMLKHGIKQGKKVGNGIQGSNFEWTMCLILFLDRVSSKLEMESLFFNDSMPEKLKHY